MPFSLDRRRVLAGAIMLPLVSLRVPVEAQSTTEIPDTVAGRYLSWTIDQLNSGGEDLTIYDLQMGTVAPNTPVEIKDVVVTTGLTFKGDAFFVEDPAGGEYSVWVGAYRSERDARCVPSVERIVE